MIRNLRSQKWDGQKVFPFTAFFNANLTTFYLFNQMSDYLPRRDSELVTWGTNFTEQINLHLTEWSIPSDEYYALNTALQNFVHLHMQVDSPAKTHTHVIEKDAARKEFERLVRGLVDFRLKNPIITDAQRSDWGIPIHKTKHTPIPVPTTYPEVEIDTSVIRQIGIHFRDYRSENKAKPFGVHGAEIRWDKLENPPANVEDLKHSSFDTKTPLILTFEESDRGKRVYFCLRWENTKGEKGPWGEIVSAIIP
jgi:hypothetical protein